MSTFVDTPSTRLIIKNLPKYITAKRLKDILGEIQISDIKLLHTPDGRFRRLAFIGFENIEDSKQTKLHLDQTYIDTQKISVEYALPVGHEKLLHEQKIFKREKNKEEIIVQKNIEMNESYRQNNDDLIENFPEIGINEEDREKFNEFLKLHGKNGKIVKSISKVKNLKTDESDSNVETLNSEAIQKTEMDEEPEVFKEPRLFIRNLPFTATEDDISEYFGKYGEIESVHIVRNKNTWAPKGFAYVLYKRSEDAVVALNELDGSALNGRVIHILSAISQKTDPEPDLENMPFKIKKKLKASKAASNNSHEWNTLFLGAKATTDVITKRLDVSKEEFLSSEKNKLTPAVRLAIGESGLVDETKKFLLDHGVDLSTFGKTTVKRSRNVILVKNLPHSTSSKEILSFINLKLIRDDDEASDYTQPRVILPPHGIAALLEFDTPSQASYAFKRLFMAKFKNTPFYIEWAPESSIVRKFDSEQNEIIKKAPEHPSTDGITVYMKNLNFGTTEETLKEIYSQAGPLKDIVIAKKKSKDSGNLLSMGYGFLVFEKKEHAMTALKNLQNKLIDGHQVSLKMSTSSGIRSNKYTEKLIPEADEDPNPTILVRNIPFEASKEELAQLFGSFGNIKMIRLPLKQSATESSRHRGFAFVQFLTKEDATSAFESLASSTHLYGRRLVLEWASSHNSLTSLQEKASITLKKASGYKRKKANLEIE